MTRPLITEQRLDIDCRGLMGTRGTTQNIAQIFSNDGIEDGDNLSINSNRNTVFFVFLLNICEIPKIDI